MWICTPSKWKILLGQQTIHYEWHVMITFKHWWLSLLLNSASVTSVPDFQLALTCNILIGNRLFSICRWWCLFLGEFFACPSLVIHKPEFWWPKKSLTWAAVQMSVGPPHPAIITPHFLLPTSSRFWEISRKSRKVFAFEKLSKDVDHRLRKVFAAVSGALLSHLNLKRSL